MSLHSNKKFAQRFICSLSRLWERVGEREACMAGFIIEDANDGHAC